MDEGVAVNSGASMWVKRGAYAVLGIVLFLFAFVWLGEHVDDFIRWKIDREARAYEALVEADRQKLIALEKADTYGSTTPEGTIELIISALEKGDVELASKYYYVLDQEKALAGFKKQQSENGNLNVAITFFKDILRGEKKCNEENDGCTFSFEYLTTEDEYVTLANNPEQFFVPRGSKERKSGDFSLNTQTGLWKSEKR
jgi:hypothetical protein